MGLWPVYVTRTNDPEKGYETKKQLREDTEQHIYDVGSVLRAMGYELAKRADEHDWSKLEYFDEFAKDTLEREDTPDFKQRNWYKIHTTKERHHINARVPEDVNLFDLLELISDCVVAGKTRSGSVNDDFLVIPQKVLNNAYWNTVKLVKENVELYEE
ncbi:MAG: hypothetical protein IJH63_00675 [Methanobrevibacter sp.]|nr:hypothetical protein [Methanosphaera sp.]MBR0369218.1 hypothetical protein [Methanobrevibacter sp.]